METKYTKGPWKAVSAVASAEFDCMEIAEVAYMRVVPECGGWPQQGTPEEDAYLIAAAPDQHAALLHADGCFQAALCEGWIDALADGDIDRIRDIWSRRISAAFQPIPSAIAKAEGR